MAIPIMMSESNTEIFELMKNKIIANSDSDYIIPKTWLYYITASLGGNNYANIRYNGVLLFSVLSTTYNLPSLAMAAGGWFYYCEEWAVLSFNWAKWVIYADEEATMYGWYINEEQIELSDLWNYEKFVDLFERTWNIPQTATLSDRVSASFLPDIYAYATVYELQWVNWWDYREASVGITIEGVKNTYWINTQSSKPSFLTKIADIFIDPFHDNVVISWMFKTRSSGSYPGWASFCVLTDGDWSHTPLSFS